MNVDNRIQRSGRKKLLLLGESGCGKSALCNALSQHTSHNHNQQRKLFHELSSDDPGLGGKREPANIVNVNILGKEESPVTLIDTVGQDSIDGAKDFAALLQRKGCGRVHIFGIVIDSLARVRPSLIKNISIFEVIFGKGHFWLNAVLILNKSSQTSNDSSDETLLKQFSSGLTKRCQIPHVELNTFILHAKCNNLVDDEQKQFKHAAKQLLNVTFRSSGAHVTSVNSINPTQSNEHGYSYRRLIGVTFVAAAGLAAYHYREKIKGWISNFK